MIEQIIVAIAGTCASLLIPAGLFWFQAWNRRRIYGQWAIAIQAPYYETEQWHIQTVDLKFSLLGVFLKSIKEEGKLKWSANLRFLNGCFLVGSWRSNREGSSSHGYISLQISSSGEHFWGHIYGDAQSNRKCKIGNVLMARSKHDLNLSWRAMEQGQLTLVDLKSNIDYNEKTSQ